MGREEQVRDAKCTRSSLPVEGLAPRLPTTFTFVVVSKINLRVGAGVVGAKRVPLVVVSLILIIFV